MTAGGACPICGMGTTGGWGSPHLVRPCPLALQEHTQRMAHAEVEHRERIAAIRGWPPAQSRRRCCGTTWQEGHRGTCKLGQMSGGAVADFWRDE